MLAAASRILALPISNTLQEHHPGRPRVWNLAGPGYHRVHLTLWQRGLQSQKPWITPSMSKRVVLAYTTHANLRTFGSFSIPYSGRKQRAGWETPSDKDMRQDGAMTPTYT
ncbi:hypothetical protein F5B21DRAFT_364592 [Xylaria acuta]|nr:hypothetical protein F5B21DRAFT_364592 [Xylaria acuta]